MKRYLVCETCGHIVYRAQAADGRIVFVTSARLNGSDPSIPRGVVHEPREEAAA